MIRQIPVAELAQALDEFNSYEQKGISPESRWVRVHTTRPTIINAERDLMPDPAVIDFRREPGGAWFVEIVTV